VFERLSAVRAEEILVFVIGSRFIIEILAAFGTSH
jgi:hypothetical protein